MISKGFNPMPQEEPIPVNIQEAGQGKSGSLQKRACSAPHNRTL